MKTAGFGHNRHEWVAKRENLLMISQEEKLNDKIMNSMFHTWPLCDPKH